MMQFRKDRKAPWRVQYRAAAGKRVGRLCSKSFKSKQDAIEFEASLIQNRQREKAGLSSPLEEITFFDFAARWIERRFKSELATAYVMQDSSRLKNYWLPDFANRALITITALEIRNKLDEIQFDLGHSAADRNRHRALVHKLFQDAFLQDKVLVNPASKCELIKEKNSRTRIALTIEEQTAYLSALRNEGRQYWVLGNVLLWTGARICSANVLRFGDINEGIVAFSRIEERATKKVVERQKGGNAVFVPLFPALASVLRRETELRDPKPTDYVCVQPGGGYIPYDTFKKVHRRAIASVKLRAFKIHDLRSTFAKNAEQAGYSKSELKEMLGHSSVLVTERYTPKDVAHLVEKGKKLGFGKLIIKQVRGSHK